MHREGVALHPLSPRSSPRWSMKPVVWQAQGHQTALLRPPNIHYVKGSQPKKEQSGDGFLFPPADLALSWERG